MIFLQICNRTSTIKIGKGYGAMNLRKIIDFSAKNQTHSTLGKTGRRLPFTISYVKV
jgi:hypothetical protein